MATTRVVEEIELFVFGNASGMNPSGVIANHGIFAQRRRLNYTVYRNSH